MSRPMTSSPENISGVSARLKFYELALLAKYDMPAQPMAMKYLEVRQKKIEQ
jgi:hypothetical protein